MMDCTVRLPFLRFPAIRHYSLPAEYGRPRVALARHGRNFFLDVRFRGAVHTFIVMTSFARR